MPEQTFRADRATYIRAHVLMAILGGIAASVLLYVIGNPHGWVGLPAALMGIGVRGWYMMSEELGNVWTLTRKDLSSTMGRHVLLDNIDKVRLLGSAVQIITRSGDKHLIKFLSDPAGVKATIEAELTRSAT